jgi:2-oxoglutarate dehydrogenase E2 component (dihydrolipoamide succinyltransferase)
MSTEVRVPTLGESVSEATIGKWFVKVGDTVKQDQPLAELETDKVALEVVAPASGVILEITAKEGETVVKNALLASIQAGAVGAAPIAAAAPVAAVSAPVVSHASNAGPAATKLAAETGINIANLAGAGKDGRPMKADVVQASLAPVAAPVVIAAPRVASAATDSVREERVRMTKLRQTIARRLKEAQTSAAMLTTFNEVDMSSVMALRTQYKDLFEKKHGVKLGFMGFFVKACTQALKEIPAVNAEIDGTDIIYKNYAHIGVAVGTEKGLVVPVVRDADQMSIAQIEKSIGGYGKKARDGQLKIEDMQGGTFTISNGGVYGSLMSTPILNAPQSGILGMHKIQDRPMVVNGKIEIRPMMYLALSYDHRIVDGKEAVTFLVRVKEGLEDPARLVMDL